MESEARDKSSDTVPAIEMQKNKQNKQTNNINSGGQKHSNLEISVDIFC